MKLFTKLYLKIWHLEKKYSELFDIKNWREVKQDKIQEIQEFTISDRILNSWSAASRTYVFFAKEHEIDAEKLIS